MDQAVFKKLNTIITLLEKNKIVDAEDFFINDLQYVLNEENIPDEIIDLIVDIEIYIEWQSLHGGVDLDSIKIDFLNITNPSK